MRFESVYMQELSWGFWGINNVYKIMITLLYVKFGGGKEVK